MSYLAALTLSTDISVYLLLNDGDQNCEETERFLKMLDLRELEEEKERKRDKYDVRIRRADDEEEVIEEEPPLEGKSCTDSEILTYALRKLPEVEPFTTDLLQKANLIRDVKKGIYILSTR